MVSKWPQGVPEKKKNGFFQALFEKRGEAHFHQLHFWLMKIVYFFKNADVLAVR